MHACATKAVAMIRIDGRGAVYGEVWFDEEPPGDCGVDIVVYRQREAPLATGRSTPFLSLVTDLSVPADDIAQQFGKDCRYKVRRADSRDGLSMELVLEPVHRLDEFRAFYDVFAQQRSLPPCDHQWMAAACRANQLALTSASRDAEALVWHAYVMTGTTAWLLYTASCFRDKDSDYRALTGRANRWLHWRDMLEFKKLGMHRYDWGGLFEDESAPGNAGINAFKRDFGGKQERTYDCTVPVTLRGRLYLPLRDAWRRLHAARH